MSDTQNTYTSSNLYSFLNWSSTINGFGPSNMNPDSSYFNNLSAEGVKKVKFLFNELPKALDEAGKSYLGLTRIKYTKYFFCQRVRF